jgi:hypothetical protein
VRGWLTIAFLSALAVAAASCESVAEQFGVAVENEYVECVDVPRSRTIRRICYDEASQSMVLDFENRLYQFCRVDRTKVEAFIEAKSMAQFFSQLRRKNRC